MTVLILETAKFNLAFLIIFKSRNTLSATWIFKELSLQSSRLRALSLLVILREQLLSHGASPSLLNNRETRGVAQI